MHSRLKHIPKKRCLMSKWSPESWKDFALSQAPGWINDKTLKNTIGQLRKNPPLVFKDEIKLLKSRLSRVHDGEYFIIQGGDCAETFSDFSSNLIKNKLNILLQMSVLLSYTTSMKTIRIGRMAGQFAKPRTNSVEIVNNYEYPSYRGDAINGLDCNIKSRTPNPARMIKAYNQSAFTLNLIRSMINSGHTSILNASQWDLDFINKSPHFEEYNDIIYKIQKALSFIETVDRKSSSLDQIELYEFFASHEGLILEYEQALTRYDANDKKYYDHSGHMIWVGDRTRSINGSHIEFVSGIENPIGIKLGPSIECDELIEIIKKINPKNEKGKIILIARFGVDYIEAKLPKLINHINKNNLRVIWMCDPMHGNTYNNDQGIKTRHFNTIVKELELYMKIHKLFNTFPGGIHIEFTSENVTECLGGFQNINDNELLSRYETACDPRLNNQQSLELIFKLNELMKQGSYDV